MCPTPVRLFELRGASCGVRVTFGRFQVVSGVPEGI